MVEGVRDGFEFDGVTIEGLAVVGCGPIRHGWLPLGGGLTVLYGVNGAGKTTVLNGLRSALTGLTRPAEGQASLLVRVENDDLPDASLAATRLVNVLPVASAPSISDVIAAAVVWDGFDSLEEDPDAAREFAAQRRFLVAGIGELTPRWTVIPAAVLGDNTHALQAWVRRDQGASQVAVPLFVGPDGEPADGLPPIMLGPASRYGEALLPRVLGEDDTVVSVTADLRELLGGLPGDGTLISALVHGVHPAVPHGAHPLTEDGPAAVLVETCHALASTATTELRRLMPTSLALEPVIQAPHDWLRGEPVNWMGVTYSGARLPLEELSKAELRWSLHAIGTAHQHLRNSLRTAPLLGGSLGIESGVATVRVIDEPEAALHRRAEAHMARALIDTPAQEVAVVATHSPALLDAGQAVYLVSPRADGGNCLAAWHADQQRDLETLGLSRSDLLGRYTTMLAVEGPHEKWILEELLGPELEELRVTVQPVYGGSRTPDLVHADFIYQYTDWVVVAMWDNLAAATLADTWDGAGDMVAQGATRDELRAFLRSRLSGSVESKFALQFMEQALSAGTPRRFAAPFAMTRKDILHYLPPRALSPDLPATWEDIARQHSNQGGNKSEKQWLSEAFGVTFDEDTVRDAVRTLDSDSVSAEFTDLLQHLGTVRG